MTMPHGLPSADSEGMRILRYAWLPTLLVALAALAAACGDDDAKAREEALRAAVTALRPEGAEMSEAEIGNCANERDPEPSCIIVNFFFPPDDAYSARQRRGLLRGKIEAEGWTFLAAGENPDAETAVIYYQRGEQYLTLLVVADKQRERCGPGLRDLQGGYIASSCVDRVSLYGAAPLGLDLHR
jgi:hypothetical protein